VLEEVPPINSPVTQNKEAEGAEEEKKSWGRHKKMGLRRLRGEETPHAALLTVRGVPGETTNVGDKHKGGRGKRGEVIRNR